VEITHDPLKGLHKHQPKENAHNAHRERELHDIKEKPSPDSSDGPRRAHVETKGTRAGEHPHRVEAEQNGVPTYTRKMGTRAMTRVKGFMAGMDVT
jgi:hypothetical protein